MGGSRQRCRDANADPVNAGRDVPVARAAVRRRHHAGAADDYGASEGLRTLLVERDALGGQAGTSSQIENYLGFPNGVSGADLARRATLQARRFGAEIISAQ